MNKIIKKIVTQRKVKLSRTSFIIGGFQNIYGQLMSYYSIFNSMILLSMFYINVIQPTPYLQWIKLPLFIIFLISGLIIAGFFIWHIVIPHYQAYGNYISYNHGSLLANDHRVIENKIDELNKKVDTLSLTEKQKKENEAWRF